MSRASIVSLLFYLSYVIKVDLHGGNLFSNATHKARLKGHHFAYGICVRRGSYSVVLFSASTSTNVNGWSSSWHDILIASWVVSRAGQLYAPRGTHGS